MPHSGIELSAMIFVLFKTVLSLSWRSVKVPSGQTVFLLNVVKSQETFIYDFNFDGKT